MFAKMFKPALLVALATAPAATSLTTQPSTPSLEGKMSGVWEITGTPDPSSGVQPFVNFATISADGSIVNADPEVGTGVGEVYRSWGNDFTIGFFGYFDAFGPAQYEVQATITLDPAGGTFAGPFRTFIRDLQGNLLMTYEGTVAAVRVAAQGY